MALKRVSVFLLFVAVNCVLSEFNLTIVQISDFHSHWFEFDEKKGECSAEESLEGKCFGGFARLLSFVRDIRKREKNVLVLSSGEWFIGRTLHYLHGWKLAHALLPRLELDAMSLSNRDFDSGIFELSAWLYAMKFPVLCTNMWARESSYLYSRVNKSVVLDIAGEKVAVVGYIHRYALKKTAPVVSMVFSPEIPALQKEVRRLEEEEGVDKIIALGHAGYYTDLEIARNVKGVDVVMGGDSDILLFDPGNGSSGEHGNVHGNYPRVHEHRVENDTNLENRTLVLHIPQHGHYVGVLHITFDDRGKIIRESGEPVLLDSRYPQDEETLQFLNTSIVGLKQLHEHMRLPDDSEILAKLSEDLDGHPRSCRMGECTMGNFMAEAFLHEFTFHYRNGSEHRNEYEKWGPIDAAVFNSGSFLHSLEAGHITLQDILRAVTLGAFIKRVHMSGQQVTELMENSVKNYDPKGITPSGCFLQVAGLRVEYDLNRAPGKRVKSLQIRCRDCEDDSFLPVKLYKTYVIAMPSFVASGGDGFKEFEDHDFDDMGQFDALLLVEYLKRMFNIDPVLDGRINFYNSLHSDTKKAKMPSNVATPQSVSTRSITEDNITDKSDIKIKSQHDLEQVMDGKITAKIADFNRSTLNKAVVSTTYENTSNAQNSSVNFPGAAYPEESLTRVKKPSSSEIHDEDVSDKSGRMVGLSKNQTHEDTTTKHPFSSANDIESDEALSFSVHVNGTKSREDLNFIKNYFASVLNSNKGNVSLASKDVLNWILSCLKYSNTSDGLYNRMKQSIDNHEGYTVTLHSDDKLTSVDLVENLLKSIANFMSRNQSMSENETSQQTQGVDNLIHLISADESKLEMHQKADSRDKSSLYNIDSYAFNVTSMQTLLAKLVQLLSTDSRSYEGLQEAVQTEEIQLLLKGVLEMEKSHDWLKNTSFTDMRIPHAGQV